MNIESLLGDLPAPIDRIIRPWFEALFSKITPNSNRLRELADLGIAGLDIWIAARLSDRIAMGGAHYATIHLADTVDGSDRADVADALKEAQKAMSDLIATLRSALPHKHQAAIGLGW